MPTWADYGTTTWADTADTWDTVQASLDNTVIVVESFVPFGNGELDNTIIPVSAFEDSSSNALLAQSISCTPVFSDESSQALLAQGISMNCEFARRFFWEKESSAASNTWTEEDQFYG